MFLINLTFFNTFKYILVSTNEVSTTHSLLLNMVNISTTINQQEQQQKSAFRPLIQSTPTFNNNNNLNPTMNFAAATAAMSKFITSVQSSNQPNLNTFSNLFRQNSIGGFEGETVAKTTYRPQLDSIVISNASK